MDKNKVKKKRKISRYIFLLFIIVMLLTYYFARFESPKKYQITPTSISSEKLPAAMPALKIAFISDINIQDLSIIKRLDKIIHTLNQEKPDIILFGGDLYSEEPFNNKKVASLLKKIKSTYGKFAVLGEKDILYKNDCVRLLNDAGFEVLQNEYRKLQYHKTNELALFGLESNGDISGLLTTNNSDLFKLVVVHEPDYFEETKTHNIDLQLSGHSMGGYINIPLYGPLFKRNNAMKYSHGTYHEKQSTLRISNGVGMEPNHQYRLFTPNEVVLVTITGKQS